MTDARNEHHPLLLHQFFENSARRWPEGIAVEVPPDSGRTTRTFTTYAELSRESRKIAGLLGGLVKRECVVAILLPRQSHHLYAAQLGVMMAGAAYTCIDPAFPDARIREILEDSAAVAFLTDAAGMERARVHLFGAPPQFDVTGVLPPAEELATPAWLNPASLAYTIYTSGTTGRPKAVMIEHRSVANLVASDLEEFRLAPGTRVSQNSSSSYDSSVEEIWLGFAAGGTLVMMDEETARLGPDLVDWLRRERIAVFCPPPTQLRAIGCENPAVDLPELEFVYLGGEALPQDISDHWAPGKLLVNGWGPTECTVTTTRANMHAGSPVHIGKPIRGLQAWILDDALNEVPDGQWGELTIGGVALARGYWNRPELTDEKFPTHPKLGRIYRSGDLAHRDAAGNLHCHGRIDSQVKIRGYRVELEEIEAHLAACPGVHAAACRIQEDGGQALLAAFLIPTDAAAPPSPDSIKTLLREIVPAYMVPARFGFLEKLPVTVGGKLNRSVLPHLDAPAVAERSNGVAPRDALETLLAGAFGEVLGLAQAVSIQEDFFSALGGDSLRAAQLITRLRRLTPATPVAVRDVYETRTVEALAERLRAAPQLKAAAPAAKAPERRRGGHPFLATVVQTIWLLLTFTVLAGAAYYVIFEAAPRLSEGLGILPLLMLAPVVFFAGLVVWSLLAIGVTVLAKRALVGKYRPLEEPAWGSFYVRNWMVQQIARAIPWWVMEGTEFQLATLRALGARIGERVHFHRGVTMGQGGWDLLDIGDDVTVGQDASLGLVEMDAGCIVVAPISLGDGATVDIRAGVAGGASLGRGAWLTSLSWLPPGAAVPAGERWDGIPARAAGRAPEVPALTDEERTLSPFWHGVWMVLARYAIGTLPVVNLELLAILAVGFLEVDAARLNVWLTQPSVEMTWLPLMVILASLSVPLSLLVEAFILRLLGRVPEGVISRWSLSYIRVWLKPGILYAAGEWLSGTLFWPYWLRLAGMKIGPGCEISTILDVVPELVEIGPECFFADGIYLAGPRIYRGTVTLTKTRISKNTFLGNHAVVPSGQSLPENILLGVCTVADDRIMRTGTSWFGHPPFELPVREVVAVDRSLTYDPSFIRYWNRVFWELLRFALPAAPTVVAVVWLQAIAMAAPATPWPELLFWRVPLATFGAGTVLILLVLVLKWGLLGRVKPGQHPLWSCWCSRWDFLYVAWAVYSRGTLAALEGTLLLSWYLRAMGVKLGKRVVLGGGFSQVVDPDMLTIEDDATVSSTLQSHTFEDRVLKIDRVVIRSRATLGTNSVPLYGADIGAGTHVAPHSVIMKHEHLLAELRYEGAPTRLE
jgi:non-ribosomal peptide synthetase-like protein